VARKRNDERTADSTPAAPTGTVLDVDGGTRWEHAKRRELERCRRELAGARAHLDALVERSRTHGLEVEELEDLGPVTYEIARLRRRDERLTDELAAIAAEWAA
jgi:hypothetical protein